MKIHLLFTCALALALSAGVLGQSPSAPPDTQQQNGQQGGRGYGRGMGGGFGRGVMGNVTEVAADHYMVKNDQGETWTVHYSANTRMMKQPARPANAPARGQGQGQAQSQGQGEGQGQGSGMNMRRGGPPEPIKSSDIKVGDAIAAMGEMDDAAKSIGAVMVMQLDPDTARRMEEMRANFGKTWLAGRVTAIKDTTVTRGGRPGQRRPHLCCRREHRLSQAPRPHHPGRYPGGRPRARGGRHQERPVCGHHSQCDDAESRRRPSPTPGPAASVKQGPCDWNPQQFRDPSRRGPHCVNSQ